MRCPKFLFTFLLAPFAMAFLPLCADEVAVKYDESFLDRYRLTIKEVQSSLHAPSSSGDAYLVSTSFTFKNGLRFTCFSKDYNHESSAIDYKETQEWLYQKGGRYPPGTEVYLSPYFEINNYTNKIEPTNMFWIRPCMQRGCFGDSSSILDNIPFIVYVKEVDDSNENIGWFWNSTSHYHTIEIRLSDGSLWRLDNEGKQLKTDWAVGEHILVSPRPKKILLINLDKLKNENPPYYYQKEVHFLGVVE